MSFIQNLLSSLKGYFSDNAKKHRELKAQIREAQQRWDEQRNIFPEEIKALVSQETGGGPTSEIILLNDDQTPMEYVVFVLEQLFSLTNSEAVGKMLEVHEKGASTVVGNIPSDSATKLVFYLRGHSGSRGYLLKWQTGVGR